MRSAMGASSHGDRASSTWTWVSSSDSDTLPSVSVTLVTTLGSRRPSLKRRASTSAEVAASDRTRAASLVSNDIFSTASRLGPTTGRTRAG